ncbi:MAG: sialidase family protein [Kiritimatiellae bacterium]|nr:sialidase family protein [Kiritimatiellia bacterium]
MLRKRGTVLGAVMILAAGLSAYDVPEHKQETVLSDWRGQEQPYLAFPALLDLGDDILVSYKRGKAHAADPGAFLEMLRLDGSSGAVKECKNIAALDGQIMQMGEWARFANGDIANYIDAQKKGQPSRIGLRVVRSSDNGKTFGPVERVGVIDGVEYGYAFEAITRGQTTWMLVMTFTNLTGGVYSKTLQRPVAGSVDVVRTEDNGRSWKFVRSITSELGGASINESSFSFYKDGFILAARGYDNCQWLVRLDADWKLVKKVNLTAENDFIKSHVGRPRVFERGGRWYLLGRNSIEKGPMRLSLFRFDPETFVIKRHVMLDNAEGAKVTDGYYAMPYWRESNGKTMFNVVNYKAASGAPVIHRLEFDWEEVR